MQRKQHFHFQFMDRSCAGETTLSLSVHGPELCRGNNTFTFSSWTGAVQRKQHFHFQFMDRSCAQETTLSLSGHGHVDDELCGVKSLSVQLMDQSFG